MLYYNTVPIKNLKSSKRENLLQNNLYSHVLYLKDKEIVLSLIKRDSCQQKY